MKKPVKLKINGQDYDLELAPQTTLLEALRDHLSLRGTKEACDGGECGACTVLSDGSPVLSCLTLALDGEGKNITTIEGLAKNGKLSAVQEAFVTEGAIQCGFCTSGMVLSAQALLENNPRPSREEATRALSGNLCRCTGYAKAIAAVLKAAEGIPSAAAGNEE